MAPAATTLGIMQETVDECDDLVFITHSIEPPTSEISTTSNTTLRVASRKRATFASDPTRDADRDAWRNEPDPRLRKRIQDRLAQRARRKRLAELKQTSQQGQSAGHEREGEGGGEVEPSSTGEEAMTLIRTSPMEQSAFAGMTTADGLKIPEYCPIPLISNDHRALRLSQFSICAALYINGIILGLSCSHVEATLSKPTTPATPPALQPTPLQLHTEHIPWFDRFPFPSMRDNAIVLTNNRSIDPEEFLTDLFLMRSFELRDGGVSWDPKAWRIGRDFGAKWGWLFC